MQERLISNSIKKLVSKALFSILMSMSMLKRVEMAFTTTRYMSHHKTSVLNNGSLLLRFKSTKRQYASKYNSKFNYPTLLSYHESKLFISERRNLYNSITNNNNVDNESRNDGSDIVLVESSKYGQIKRSSTYNSHFICGVGEGVSTNRVTVLNAVLSVIPEELKHVTADSKEMRRMEDVSSGEPLTALELLDLGSIWYLPAEHVGKRKPSRLTLNDADRVLEEGDYLRVHHSPRRFPIVHQYDWGEPIQCLTGLKQGVVVARDDSIGYLIIDKPVGISTNPTVDNNLECVVTAVKQQQQIRQIQKNKEENNDDEAYVTIPQRLDQLTSGLLILATKKSFATYFSKLLSNKTHHHVNNNDKTTTTNKSVRSTTNTTTKVYKKYKCLVCIMSTNDNNDDSTVTVHNQMNRLRTWVNNETILQHFIKPSFLSKKVFSKERDSVVVDGVITSTWSECLLRIIHVSDKVYPVYVNNTNCSNDDYIDCLENDAVAATLWKSNENIPKNCQAVVELEIELLTGRTHQIRGQLSNEGFPIVGDVLYGGAISDFNDEYTTFSTYRNLTHSIALQCCQLSFLDPNTTKTTASTTTTTPIINKESNDDDTSILDASSPSSQHVRNWNHFYLKDAWWTPFLTTFSKYYKSYLD